MSKVKDLPEITALADNDLLYTVDVSEGANGGRKITKDNLKTSVAPTAAETKTAYESNADTNAFTDAEKTKLASVEVNAQFQDADEVPYDNSTSGLTATQVQAAIDEVTVRAQADFRPSIVSGRILHHGSGQARFDDMHFDIIAGDILLNPSISFGEIYVDLDGIVKQSGSGIAAPPLSIVIAKFSTDLSDITYLLDERVKNTQNLVRGLLADVKDVRAGAAASAGSTGRLSDAGHKHNIVTAAPITQIPEQANAEGTAVELARADHIHNIGTDAPIALTPNQVNAEGTSNDFSRADHVHNIAATAPVTQIPDQANAEGVATSFARADHVHNIAADAPSTPLSPATTNTEGSSNSFSRADHTHEVVTGLVADITTIQPDDAAAAGVLDKFARADHKHAISAAAPAAQAPDQANAEGVSTSFARADHVHNIPADAPTTTLSPATSNSEGVGSSFSRNDHAHAIATGLVGELAAIQPDDAAAAGVVDKFARIDHRHAIAAAAPSTTLAPSTTNAEGVATSFSRADHTHAVGTGLVADITTIQPDDAAAAGTTDRFARADHKHAIVAAAPSNTGIANSEGVSTSFARADHVHNTVVQNNAIRTNTPTNTSSTSDVLITSMSLTPGAGTYAVFFEGAALDSNNTATMTFSLYANGVQISNSERGYVPTNATIIGVASNGIATVADGQAIEVRYRTSAGTVTINGRSLTLLRIG